MTICAVEHGRSNCRLLTSSFHLLARFAGASSKWSTQRQNSGVVLRKNVQALRNAIMVAAAVSAVSSALQTTNMRCTNIMNTSPTSMLDVL